MYYLHLVLFLLPMVGAVVACIYIIQTKNRWAKQLYASGVNYEFVLGGSVKAKWFSVGLSLMLIIYLYIQLYDILTASLSIAFSKHILRYCVIYIIIAIDIWNLTGILLKSTYIADQQVCICHFRQTPKIYLTKSISSIKEYDGTAKSSRQIQYVYVDDEIIFTVSSDDPNYSQFYAWVRRNNISCEAVTPKTSDFFK